MSKWRQKLTKRVRSYKSLKNYRREKKKDFTIFSNVKQLKKITLPYTYVGQSVVSVNH